MSRTRRSEEAALDARRYAGRWNRGARSLIARPSDPARDPRGRGRARLARCGACVEAGICIKTLHANFSLEFPSLALPPLRGSTRGRAKPAAPHHRIHTFANSRQRSGDRTPSLHGPRRVVRRAPPARRRRSTMVFSPPTTLPGTIGGPCSGRGWGLTTLAPLRDGIVNGLQNRSAGRPNRRRRAAGNKPSRRAVAASGQSRAAARVCQDWSSGP